MGVRDLLFSPDRFYQERAKETERLAYPALIVAAVGIIGAISSYLVAQVTVQILPENVQQAAGGIALVSGAIGGFAGAFFLWVVASGIFFAISAVFKGQGGFKQTLAAVGYGFLPQIFGGLISLYFISDFVSTVRIPHVTDLTNQTALQQAIQALMNHPSFQLATVIGILFLLWSANIWIFGIKHARGLSTRHAAISIVVPVGIYVAYSLFNLYTLITGGG